MTNIKLIGSPYCRRYRKMRSLVIDVAKQLGIPYSFEEVNDTEQLAQINPLSLPRLYINETLITSGNPPNSRELVMHMQNA